MVEEINILYYIFLYSRIIEGIIGIRHIVQAHVNDLELVVCSSGKSTWCP